MKYKVGDVVRIKSIDWYNNNCDQRGSVSVKGDTFVSDMSQYCGKLAKITKVFKNMGKYHLDIDNGRWHWTDEMFKGNMKETKIKLPEGWEIDRVENGEIILKESKKELPKTWEECLQKLENAEYIDTFSSIHILGSDIASREDKNVIPVGLGEPMLALMQLLVCREAYRQGWKPNWKDGNGKYCIVYQNNEIVPACYLTNHWVLSFQSEEIRNKFLENFRDLIEVAKELI